MRIIKSCGNRSADIKCIIGEMLNIETSTLSYGADGELLPEGSRKKGYPKQLIDTLERTYKLSAGNIFVTGDVDIDKLQEEIKAAISSFRTEHLIGPVSLYAGLHTNLRVTCNGTKAPKRIFVSGMGFPKSGQFVWHFLDKSVDWDSQHQCSPNTYVWKQASTIVYDVGDMIALDHGAIVFDFGYKYYRGAEFVHDVKIVIAVISEDVPVRLDIIALRCKNNAYLARQNIPRNLPIYKMPFAAIVHKLGANKTKDGMVVCIRCDNILYDDNYVVCPKGRGAVPEAICVVCIHLRPIGITFHNYKAFLRVTFPVTKQQCIEMIESAAEREIISAMAKNNMMARYQRDVPVGDEWIGISSKYEYFKNRSKNDMRKVFVMVPVLIH